MLICPKVSSFGWATVYFPTKLPWKVIKWEHSVKSQQILAHFLDLRDWLVEEFIIVQDFAQQSLVVPGMYSNFHILWCALAPNEPSKWFRFSHCLPLSQSCFLGAEEGGGPDTPVAFCLFINSSLSKPAIRGNLQMRLRLTENIQLALYLKLPEIHTVFKIADDLSSARASSPPTSTPFSFSLGSLRGSSWPK